MNPMAAPSTSVSGKKLQVEATSAKRNQSGQGAGTKISAAQITRAGTGLSARFDGAGPSQRVEFAERVIGADGQQIGQYRFERLLSVLPDRRHPIFGRYAVRLRGVERFAEAQIHPLR